MASHDRSARRAQFTLAGIGLLAVAAVTTGVVFTVSVLEPADGKAPHAAKPTTSAPVSSHPSGLWNKDMTPAKAKPFHLVAPTGQANGISTGFPHNTKGAISMAVYFTEEYALLDDQKARQQLEAAVSPDTSGYVDQKVSEVRKLREGVGLPPSGGNPAGLTFTTSVKAVRAKTIRAEGLPLGDVLHIWFVYDRYATGPDGGADKNPLRDETSDVIVKWQNGAWKLTNEPELWAKRTYPVAYDPDSPYAWQDGWWQVLHED